MSETSYEGYEVEQPEGFMEPKRYRVSYRCEKCGHAWKKTYKAIPSDDPACPSVKCAVDTATAALALQVANLTRMLQEQRAPGVIGDKLGVKAIDMTAEMVMRDNNLTDLKDNIRTGESMAPKLPPPMQKAADSFFGGGAGKALGTGKPVETRMQRQMKALGARAIRGAFRNASVAPNMVLPKTRPVGQVQPNPGYSPRGHR